MRFVVVGAGAVGGVVGGRLAEAGHDVVLVARGDHHDAIARDGLLLRSPDGEVRLRVPVVDRASALALGSDDIVLLAVKSQDTRAALEDLAAAPDDLPIVCLQNGVSNEREALRRTARVYAVPVMLPATHLHPGVVDAQSSPVTGILDVGCYPTGVDDLARALAAAFASATFSSEARADVMRFKWSKLLLNLANALEAICGGEAWATDLFTLARAEGRAVLEAAGIDAASDEEELARRGDLITMRRIDGERRGGGSTWQSLTRGKTTLEVDHLNGEIVLLGRLHGVPTPVNDLLQRTARRVAAEGLPPGSISAADLEAELSPRA
jgi:2-dehydropantoate 2-reductase